MFEDFFNVVKKRFNDGEEEYKPPMFKCMLIKEKKSKKYMLEK